MASTDAMAVEFYCEGTRYPHNFEFNHGLVGKPLSREVFSGKESKMLQL